MSQHQQLLRLSEHPLSQKWLARFHTSKDRALASQLLNQLKLVSAREFESGIEASLIELQARLNATIAVYPVGPAMPEGIAGYDQFTGGIPRVENSQAREVGRRRKYGSEDRVGHMLTKLQEGFKRGTGASKIECQPTLNQLKTQGIRHIVLVDDVCGSGTRIADYWKTISRRIKSLLSLKRYELWIVLYAITPLGKIAISKVMPNFPLSDHLITVLPDADLRKLITPELRTLCVNYAKKFGMNSSGLGYRGSACSVVFEHGCPNNLPAILWAKCKGWEGLFPNRLIPHEMRSCFDEDGSERAIEALWRVNQPQLALSLLDALDHAEPLTAVHRMVLTLLGLSLRGVSATAVASRLMMPLSETQKLLRMAAEMGLYDKGQDRVTTMGRELVFRFRERFQKVCRQRPVGTSPEGYYPSQCEGKVRELGITGRGNSRSVPVGAQ